MTKKKYISAHNDFKTGFFYKIFLIIGIILLIFYVIQQVIPIVDISKDILGIIIAFSILFLGVGLLTGFLSWQFSKLSKIADEIEREEDTKETDDSDQG